MAFQRHPNFNKTLIVQYKLGLSDFYHLGALAAVPIYLLTKGMNILIGLLFGPAAQEHPGAWIIPLVIVLIAVLAGAVIWGNKRSKQNIYNPGGNPKARKYEDLDPRGRTPEETPWEQ